MANKDVLVVDDDVLVGESLKEMLILEGFSADAVPDGQAALAKIRGDHYQMILSDIQMPGLNGIELLKELKGRSPDTTVIFITGHGHIAGAVEAIKLGAYDYITKPINDSEIKIIISKIVEKMQIIAENEALREILAAHGEPLPYLHLHAFALAALAETGRLQFSDEALSALEKNIHTALAAPEFIDLENRSTPETGVWALKKWGEQSTLRGL